MKRRNYRNKIIGLSTILVATFSVVFINNVNNHEYVGAYSLANFDPGFIISDYVMGNYDSMTEQEIQEFLTSKNSCSNRNYDYYLYLSQNPNYKWHWKDDHFVCLSEELFGDGEKIGEGETAAHIIWQAAQDFQINPKVLMVLLQKETSLITDPIPNDGDYRKATGYGCPDTAPCSEKYYGFKNQVRNAAELFHSVLTGGWTNYPLGVNYIQYNPNKGCGGSEVNIRSLATSALYRYTPYQPNQGALDAGYGATVTCGAYGNRNFYLYYGDWFGDPTETPVTKIINLEEANIAEGTYIISAANDKDRVIDIKSGVENAVDGNKIHIWFNNGTEAQKWAFKKNENGTYTIVNPATKKALDVKSAGTTNGNPIHLWQENGTCAQQWKIYKEGDAYIFKSGCSELTMGVEDPAMSNGTQLQIWDQNNENSVRWQLEKLK